MQKAIEEAKKFVCTTKDRIVKDAKEFIQNVDWKKVAIGVAATAAITLAVVATGGAAAPVLIGAAVGAGISTGTTVVSGVIQGKSPAEIAKDASGAFMWGAIGGAVGGGTTQLLGKVGTKVIGKVGKKVIEDGVDMALDLAQTASENGGLTGKDILFSATTTLSGGLLSSVKTPSTVRNQLIDGVTDNKAVKNAVTDSTDNAVKKSSKSQTSSNNVSQIRKNAKQGRDFEEKSFKVFNENYDEAVEQITIKTNDGTKIRVDAIGQDKAGNIVIQEYKSSSTAPLTKNQKTGFPELEANGGVVVGKGKGNFTGGIEIPAGTKVNIIRP